MHSQTSRRLSLSTLIEKWPLAEPFTITGMTWDCIDILLVNLSQGGSNGHSEASGVYYRGETAASMQKQIEALRPTIEAGVTCHTLQEILPPGGARNALDCALWQLEARIKNVPQWRLCGLEKPRPLITTFTCGADSPHKMAHTARGYCGAKALKLKLTGIPEDRDRVLAVREARPDVWIGVDANQGFSRASLEWLMPTLTQCSISLVEQPFPCGQESLLDGFRSPIPIAADESVQSASDIPDLVGRFDVINIKLDKCGGLTNALEMIQRCRDTGLTAMVGNMLGTSLAMAPAYLVGQLCSIVDLDGPIFLNSDRPPRMQYTNDGYAVCPEELF